MKTIGRPIPGSENLFSNSSKRPRGAKNAGQIFMGYKTFRRRLRNANIRTYMIMDIY